jgi:hypothetical protein
MIRIIEFQESPIEEINRKVLFRVICDKPLIDDKLHPDDVVILNDIKEMLSNKIGKPVSWVWWRGRL